MTLPAIREKFHSPLGQKLFRYSMASVVAVILSNILLLIFIGIINMGEVLAASLATGLSAIPSYEMNRKWAWGKKGKSHLLKEVVPFWGLAFLGWGLSTLAVWWMGRYTRDHHFSHLAKTGAVDLVYIGAFGVLWVAKFIIFNSVMFVHHHHEHDEEPHDTPAAA